MACTEYLWAKDENGDALPFTVDVLVRRDGSSDGVLHIPSGSYATKQQDTGIEYDYRASNEPAGWEKDPDTYYITNCSLDVTFVYTEIVYDDYYVETTGDDEADGTSWANAWKTINKAATTIADGKTLHIGFGTYDQEPANNKIAPQNAGTSGIGYKCETAGSSGGTGTVKIEKN